MLYSALQLSYQHPYYRSNRDPTKNLTEYSETHNFLSCTLRLSFTVTRRTAALLHRMPESPGKSRDNCGTIGRRDGGAMFYTKPHNSTEYRGTHISAPSHTITYPQNINPHRKEPRSEHISFTMLRKSWRNLKRHNFRLKKFYCPKYIKLSKSSLNRPTQEE
jgi:hypothetical protein